MVLYDKVPIMISNVYIMVVAIYTVSVMVFPSFYLYYKHLNEDNIFLVDKNFICFVTLRYKIHFCQYSIAVMIFGKPTDILEHYDTGLTPVWKM
jgi:hypothetical protein